MSGPPVKAMVVIRRPGDGAVLVQRDTALDRSFERLLGGHLDLGELAEDTARREMREEIGREIRVVRRLDVVENHWITDGVSGHEIVFVFEAEFAHPADYDFDQLTMFDEPTVVVRWRAIGEIEPPLYPDGVVALLGD